MRIRFTPEAESQAEEIDTWWRNHRDKARDLFARELADAKALLVASPKVGTVHTVLDDQPVRKLVLRKTRHHLYYTCKVDEGLLIIHAVWGAPKGSGPSL